MKRISYGLFLVIMAVLTMPVLTSCSCSGRKNEWEREDAFRARRDTLLSKVKGYSALDSLSAEAWLMVDGRFGLVISEKNSRAKMYPASLTKMMTCIMALEEGVLTDTVRITEDVYKVKNSTVHLGDGYALGDLLYEMMLTSDNDAAYAVGKLLADDPDIFYRFMNHKAMMMGMLLTHFSNPNGMFHKDHFTTAEDMMKLSCYCMKDSMFAKIVATSDTTLRLADGRRLPCHNTNELLTTYKGCRGIKTGYVVEAGGCLACVAERYSVPIYLVLMNCKPWNHREREAAKLLDFGFNVVRKALLIQE